MFAAGMPWDPLSLASARNPEGGGTWCSERGSVLSAVTKSLAMRPADTMPQQSAIVHTQKPQTQRALGKTACKRN
jgi:hypothetical protein